MKKSLKLAVTKGVLFLALTQAGGVAYANGVEYSIKWDGQDKVYRVFMQPQTVPDSSDNDLYISSQVTIKVPHADNEAELFEAEDITSTNDIGWERSSVSRSPLESPTHDYLSFVAKMPSRPVNLFDWVAGEEQEVFYFSNAGACLGDVEIMDNATDPFNDFDPKDPNSSNSAGTNPGNEFSSDVWGASTDNDYLARYGDPADCTVIVNTNPTAVDDSKSVLSGNSVRIDVLSNDSDADGDSLTLNSADDGSHGTVALDANEVIYTANADYDGSDSFTYTISDGTDTSEGTVNVTVTPKDDSTGSGFTAPPMNVSLNSGESKTIDVLSSVDNSSENLTISDYTQGSFGTVTLDQGILIYAPNNNYVGIDTFQYTLSDGNGTTSSNTVTLNIADPNGVVPGTGEQVAIPTLSEWAQILLTMLLGIVGFRRFSKNNL